MANQEKPEVPPLVTTAGASDSTENDQRTAADIVWDAFVYLKHRAHIEEIDFRLLSNTAQHLRPIGGPLGVFLPVAWSLPLGFLVGIPGLFFDYAWLSMVASTGMILWITHIGTAVPWILKPCCKIFPHYRLSLASETYDKLPAVARAALQLADGNGAWAEDARSFATDVLEGRTPKYANAHLWFWACLWRLSIEPDPPPGRRVRDLEGAPPGT